MENETPIVKSFDLQPLLWIIAIVALLLSLYGVFSGGAVSVIGGVAVPTSNTASMGFQNDLRDLYKQQALATTFAEGKIVSKEDAFLLVEFLLLDLAKIEQLKLGDSPARTELLKPVKLRVIFEEKTQFPFKSRAELVVGESVVVASEKAILEGKDVVATHIYNKIPGL